MEVKKSKKANLQNKKLLFVEIGLVLALLIVLAAFEWSTKERTVSQLTDDRVVVSEEEIIAIKQDEPPPPEVPKAPVMTDEFIVVDDNVKINNEIIISTEDDKHTGVQIMNYVETKVEETVEEDIPFAIVEDKPKFMGGDENEFNKWIGKNLKYPESAQENGVQGRVTVQFTISADGSVTKVSILRSIDPALDKEAIRVISSSPKWTPGKQRGKPVPVKYQMPVVFQLR